MGYTLEFWATPPGAVFAELTRPTLDPAGWISGRTVPPRRRWSSIDHSSSGDNDFRGRFLPGPAARLLGLDLVIGLLNRDIAGLGWSDSPSFGWASPVELGPAVAGFPADLQTLTDDEDDVLALQTMPALPAAPSGSAGI